MSGVEIAYGLLSAASIASAKENSDQQKAAANKAEKKASDQLNAEQAAKEDQAAKEKAQAAFKAKANQQRSAAAAKTGRESTILTGPVDGTASATAPTSTAGQKTILGA